jgi:hypothetical protein
MLSRLKFNNNDTNTYTLIFLVIFLGYIYFQMKIVAVIVQIYYQISH